MCLFKSLQIVFIIPMFLLLGCKPYNLIQPEYTYTPIILSDFIFESWNSTGQGHGFQKDNGTISPDSIITVFTNSLNESELKFNINRNIQQQYKNNNEINFRRLNRIDTNLIKVINKTYSEQLSLIPIISFSHEYNPQLEKYNSNLQLMIILLQGQKIIYANQSNKIVYEYYPQGPNFKNPPKHTQQHWDELVKKVMQPYIDRLK